MYDERLEEKMMELSHGDNGLMPCPFCGLPPIVNNIEPHSHSEMLKGVLEDHKGSCCVECSCGCGLIDDTYENVKERWNKRFFDEELFIVMEKLLQDYGFKIVRCR